MSSDQNPYANPDSDEARAAAADYYDRVDWDNDATPDEPSPEFTPTPEQEAQRWESGEIEVLRGPTIDQVLPPEVWPVPPKEFRP